MDSCISRAVRHHRQYKKRFRNNVSNKNGPRCILDLRPWNLFAHRSRRVNNSSNQVAQLKCSLRPFRISLNTKGCDDPPPNLPFPSDSLWKKRKRIHLHRTLRTKHLRCLSRFRLDKSVLSSFPRYFYQSSRHIKLLPHSKTPFHPLSLRYRRKANRPCF